MHQPLVLVCSCKKNKELHQFYIEKFKNKINFLIVIGGQHKNYIKGNFLYLKCDDTYEMLHLKMFSAYSYIDKNLKTDILKIDDDTFLNIDKFLSYKFKYDIEGFIFPGNFCNYTYHINKVTDERFKNKISDTEIDPYYFCMGGGYYISKKALKIILKNIPLTSEYSNHLMFKKGREDRMVGQAFSSQLEKFKIKNNGYWVVEDKEDNNFLYSCFNDMVMHPFKINELDILYKKRIPRLWALSVKK